MRQEYKDHYKYVIKTEYLFVTSEINWITLFVLVITPMALMLINLFSFILMQEKYHNNDYSEYSRNVRGEMFRTFIESNFDGLNNMTEAGNRIMEINKITDIAQFFNLIK